MNSFALVLSALLALSAVHGKPTKGADKKVVCYYGSWAVYRPEPGKFPVENIDPFICTHLVYGFAGLSSSNTIRSLDAWQDLEDDWGKGAFKRFNNLKKINPKLKTILAIGGWNEGSTKYSAMASNAGSRKTFVDSVVAFLDRYGFDGLDMDWEYPANRGGKPEDKQNFVALLKDLREAFGTRLLLTAAVSAGKGTIDTAYDIPQVSRYLDFINLMTYDFHGAWETFTGHNSPLYALPTETPEQQILNMNYSVNYWISKGAPREKIILGMGLYGRGFTLQKASDNGLYATSNTPSTPGPYTREPGILGYNEICEKMTRGEKWTVVRVDHYEAPYAYLDRQWVGYDDQESIKVKSKYGMDMGLGGGMVWSIETDDFRGICHGHRYPLLTVIHNTFIGAIERPDPPTEDPFQTRPPTVTSGPVTRPPFTGPPVTSPSGHSCSSEGWFRDPNDCASYWWCYLLGNRFVMQEFHCESGTVFDLVSKTCNWPGTVPGC